MVSAGDLLTLYVGLELQSLSAYVLASFMRRDGRSAEGLKYFVLGALARASCFTASRWSTASRVRPTSRRSRAPMVVMPALGTRSLGLMFGLVFVFAGLAFKMSAVPFHMWTPDVYEGAPTPVTASSPRPQGRGEWRWPSRRRRGDGLGAQQWQQIVTFAALASIILGAVAAIGQTNIKRLLAYSSINNVGFALIGLAAVRRRVSRRC